MVRKRSEASHAPQREFSESHLNALRGGAKRRRDEQIVGNWIRVTNPVLYAQLLGEATTRPTSPALANVQLAPTPAQVEPSPRAAPQVVNDEDFRKPPPRLDIR